MPATSTRPHSRLPADFDTNHPTADQLRRLLFRLRQCRGLTTNECLTVMAGGLVRPYLRNMYSETLQIWVASGFVNEVTSEQGDSFFTAPEERS